MADKNKKIERFGISSMEGVTFSKSAPWTEAEAARKKELVDKMKTRMVAQK